MCDDSSCDIHAAVINEETSTVFPVHEISSEWEHQFTTQPDSDKTEMYHAESSTANYRVINSNKSYTEEIVEIETTSENVLYVSSTVSPPTIHCDNNEYGFLY